MPLDPSQAQTPQFDTPEMLDRKRLLALAMQRQGMDYSPIKSWTQGAARLADALVGGLQERRLDQQERAAKAASEEYARQTYGNLLPQGSMSPSVLDNGVYRAPMAGPGESPTAEKRAFEPPGGFAGPTPISHRFADPSVAFEGVAGGTATPSADMFAAATPSTPTAMTLGPSSVSPIQYPPAAGSRTQPPTDGSSGPIMTDPRRAMYPGSNIQSMDMGTEPSAATALADGIRNRQQSIPQARPQPQPQADVGRLMHILNDPYSSEGSKTVAKMYLENMLGEQKPTIVPAGATALGRNNMPIYTAPIKPSASNDPAMAERMQEARTKGQLTALEESDVVNDNAKAIAEGKQVPEINRMSNLGAAIKSKLEKMGVDVTKLDLQWKAAQRHVMSMNSDRQNRFQGLGTSVVNTIDRLKETSRQMQLSGIAGFNQAKLFYLEQYRGNTPEGQLARQYISDVTTLKEEFAGLVTGGTAPHEAAFALANKQINEDFGWKNLGSGLDEVQKLINFRLTAMQNVPVQGLPGANPYIPNVPQQSETAPPPTAPTLDQKTTTGTTWGYTP